MTKFFASVAAVSLVASLSLAQEAAPLEGNGQERPVAKELPKFNPDKPTSKIAKEVPATFEGRATVAVHCTSGVIWQVPANNPDLLVAVRHLIENAPAIVATVPPQAAWQVSGGNCANGRCSQPVQSQGGFRMGQVIQYLPAGGNCPGGNCPRR